MSTVIPRATLHWLAALSGVLYLALLVLCFTLAWPIARSPIVSASALVNVVSELVTAGAFGVIGVLIVTRRPAHRVGWLLLASGVVWGVAAGSDSYAIYALGVRGGDIPGAHFVAWSHPLLAFLGICLVVPFTLLLFPTGHLPSQRWRVVAALAGIGTVCAIVGFAIEPATTELNGLPAERQIANPYGQDNGPAYLAAIGAVGLALVALTSIASIVSVVRRLQRATAVERQQLEWISYAAGLVVLAFGLNFAANVLGPEILVGDAILLPDATSILLHLGFAVFPVSVGIAILRHGLFDIDQLIKRTLVYGVLSVCLASAYVAVVISSEWVVRRVTGQGSSLAIVAATLTVAALVQPLRGRIRDGVDRRFYRHNYDAVQTLEAFNVRLRSEIDLPTLCTELGAIVQETMQPAHVSLWLRPVAERSRRAPFR